VPCRCSQKETWQKGRALRNLKSLFSKSESNTASTQPPKGESPEEQA
jgi:hypothetical protein